MRDRIVRRLHIAPLVPEARSALAQLVESDWLRDESPRSGRRVPAVVACIYTTLSGMPAQAVQPFVDAWLTLYAALIHLDHLQDEDEDNVVAAIAPAAAAQYNLVFAYYALAMTLLDDLEPALVPIARQLRLLHLWNTSMLTTAGGQQRDLARDVPNAIWQSLEYYVASLTLPNRYAAARQHVAVELPPHTIHDYWRFLYCHYHTALRPTIDSLPYLIQTAILHLLTDTFGPCPEDA